MLTIRQWIHAAVMRKVKLLDLMFRPIEKSEDIEIPDRLVTCGSLEVFKLCLLGHPLCLPNITGFQALRVLELREVNLFDDNVVKYFLEGCPLLEDLSLIDCRANSLVISSSKLKNLTINTECLGSDDFDLDWVMCKTLKICCPKLVFLKLTGCVSLKYSFQNLYSLEKAVIHPEFLFERESTTFARISHVEYLSMSLSCISECFNPRVDAPILPNLKTLEITLDGNRSKMDALIPFLIRLPDLESLHLVIPKDASGLSKLNVDEAATMRILTRHLKKVEIQEFDEENPKEDEEKLKLDLARALLEHGNELEEMVFSWGKKKTMNQVSIKISQDFLYYQNYWCHRPKPNQLSRPAPSEND